jgi:hypothetical protein
MERLTRAGLDPRKDLRFITSAVYVTAEKEVELAAILLGEFDPAAVDRLLVDGFEVIEESGTTLIRWQDVDSCKWVGPYAVHSSPGRVILATPARLPQVLARLESAAPAAVDLATWRGFRDNQLITLALFVPEETPDLGSPLLSAPAEMARSTLDYFRSLYLGVRLRAVPAGASLAFALEGNDPAQVTATAAEWTKTIGESRESWESKMPTMARLHDALEVSAEGRLLSAIAAVDDQWWADAKGIPGEILGMIFGGLGGSMSQAAPGAEQLEENPIQFERKVDLEAIPAFAAEPPFVKEADAVAGPVGVRLVSVGLGEQDDVGLVLGIEAVHRGIPNLGNSKGRVRLLISSVRSREGRELLRDEACGHDRNDLPADVSDPSFSNSFTGKKMVRLVSNATHDEIASIEGGVIVRLPVETQTLRIEDLSETRTIARNGVRVEIDRSGPATLSYRISGDPSQLLHVRGLNAAGLELQGAGRSSSGFLFGDGTSISQSYAGQVEQAEIVFAKTDAERSFPFRIEGAKPRSSQSEHVSVRDPVEVYDPTKVDVEGAAPEIENSTEFDAITHTGPFTIAVELRKFFALNGRFEIRAPVIPGLVGNLRGAELEITRIETNDDSEAPLPEGGARADLFFDRPSGSDPLSRSENVELGTIEPSSVRALEGEIRVRLPQSLASLLLATEQVGTIASADGLSATLSKIDDAGLEIRFAEGGASVVEIVAHNAGGEPLWVPFPRLVEEGSIWRATLGTHGRALSVEIAYATAVKEKVFPFRLDRDR